MSWGDELTKLVHNCEQRFISYKKLTAEAYKAGNPELVTLFKEYRKDEQSNLKRLREEKTDWNQGTWLVG